LQQPLLSLGIDSLMAVELKNRIESSLRCTLNATLLLDYSTLETLGAHLIRNVLNLTPSTPQASNAEREPDAAVDDEISAADQPLATMQDFFIDDTGRKLCVSRWGAKDAPLVICVHGILDQAAMWDEVAVGLVENGYRVMALDLRGHGRSDHHPASVNITIMDFLADLKTMVTHTANRPFILVGHSIGSVVCGLYAGLYPEKVSHLIMIEPVAPFLREQQSALDLLSNDLCYMHDAPAHPVYPDLATAARMLTLSHGKLTLSRSMKLAQRITASCEGGLRWTWDARMRNPLGVDLYLSLQRYLSILDELKVSSTRIYGTNSQFAGTSVLLDPDLALPRAQSARVAGGHNLHTDNAPELLPVILGSVHSHRPETIKN
jgi:pimeloyl-ACP methyl ester carboxylesterase